MSTYIDFVEDQQGDLVDIRVYCWAGCAPDDVRSRGRWPSGPPESDCCTYCAECSDLLAHGLQCPAWATGDDDDCDGGTGDVTY